MNDKKHLYHIVVQPIVIKLLLFARTKNHTNTLYSIASRISMNKLDTDERIYEWINLFHHLSLDSGN